MLICSATLAASLLVAMPPAPVTCPAAPDDGAPVLQGLPQGQGVRRQLQPAAAVTKDTGCACDASDAR